MATYTFEQLQELAIIIRDEELANHNTSNRVGTMLLDIIAKLQETSGIDIQAITVGNLITMGANGLLIDSLLSAQTVANKADNPFYVNKFEPGGNKNFVYNPATPRGAAVLIPITNSSGELYDVFGMKNKVAFWLSNIVNIDGTPIAGGIDMIKDALVCIQYLTGSTIKFARLGYKDNVFATVKDLYLKYTECYFDAEMTWIAPIINGTPETTEITPQPDPSTTDTIDPYLEAQHAYIVTDATKENVLVEATGESVIQLPTDLMADKTIFFTLADSSADVTLYMMDTYHAGDVIIATFILSTQTWNVNLLTSSGNITNTSVVAVLSATHSELSSYTYFAGTKRLMFLSSVGTASGLTLTEGSLFLFKNDDAKERLGIYQIVQVIPGGTVTCVEVMSGSNINIVRVAEGTERGMWQSLYDGNDTDSIKFTMLERKLGNTYKLYATTNSSAPIKFVDKYGENPLASLTKPFLAEITCVRKGVDGGFLKGLYGRYENGNGVLLTTLNMQQATNTIALYTTTTTPSSPGIAIKTGTNIELWAVAVTSDVLNWEVTILVN